MSSETIGMNHRKSTHNGLSSGIVGDLSPEGGWTPLKLIRWTTEYFEKKGIPNPRVDSELLLATILKCQKVDLYVRYDRCLSEKDLAKFKELVERRAKREPLQYILGETEFFGLKIKVTPDVLIPRPETELLVEEIFKIPPLKKGGGGDLNILEIGTGSGCIAIALAKKLPKAKIVATDISKEALIVAKENAALHHVSHQIEFILADIAPWRVFQAEEKTFDLIVSNPPYIPSQAIKMLQSEVLFEPHGALDGGEDGMVKIKQILKEGSPFLKHSGFLILEVGEQQAAKLTTSLPQGLSFERTCRDYSGCERFVVFKKP